MRTHHSGRAGDERADAMSVAAAKDRAADRRHPGLTSAPDILTLQATLGNAAVVQMLRRAGHPALPEHRRNSTDSDGRQPQQQEAQETQEVQETQQVQQVQETQQVQQTQQTQQTQLAQEAQRSTVHDVLRGPGRPLDGATRTDMETRLGADFSDVRIHDGPAARQSAAEVGARAYTSGHHVVIGDGGADRHTLAHELTHVIQQRHGPVAGTDNGDGLRLSDPSDRFEREAEANARHVMSAPPGEAAVRRAPAEAPGRDAGAVQRAKGKNKAQTPSSGKGSASKTESSSGGKVQGDHVFNSLDSTADKIGTRLREKWENFFQTIDTDTKRAIKKDRTKWETWSKYTEKCKNALNDVTAAAAAAKEYGHPDNKNSRFASFIATLPEDSTPGSDENSAVYGSFSNTLNSLVDTCDAETWKIPQEMRDAASKAPAWSTYLASQIYDGVAAEKVLNNRLSTPAEKKNFKDWQDQAQERYANLFAAVITAMEATNEATVWLGRENNAQQQQYDPTDGGEFAGAAQEGDA